MRKSGALHKKMNGKGSMNTHKQVILLSCNRGKFQSAARFTFCATQNILVEELQQWEVMKSPPHSHQNVFSLCCYFSASLWPLPFTLCGDAGSKWGTDLLPSCSVDPLGKTGRSLACYPHAALPGSCQAQSRGRATLTCCHSPTGTNLQLLRSPWFDCWSHLRHSNSGAIFNHVFPKADQSVGLFWHLQQHRLKLCSL